MTTFEDLLNFPARIKDLTDAQIEDIVRPFFPLTRPSDLSPAGSDPLDTDSMDPAIAERLAALKSKPTLLQQLMKKKP